MREGGRYVNAPASEKKHSFFEPFAFTQHLSIRSTVVDCQDKIYSEEYEDYIVEYGSWSELVSEQYRRTVTNWQISGLPLFIWRAVRSMRAAEMQSL